MQKAIFRVGERFVAWFKRHRRKLMAVGGALLAFSILVQLLFPSTIALPFTSVVGEDASFASREQIVAIIQQRFKDADLKLVSGEQEYRDDLSVFGAAANPDQMASEVLSYPLLMRLLPLSGLWYHPQVDRFALEFTDAQLQKVAKKAHTTLTLEPSDATLTVQDDELMVETAIEGQLVSADMVVDAVKQSTYEAGTTTVNVKGERTVPQVSDEAIAAVKKQAEAMLARTITLVVEGDKTYTPTRSQVAQWITIQTNDNQSVELRLAREQIGDYLTKVNKKVQITPGVTTITLRDGKERSRQKGTPGRAIPIAAAARKISQRLMTTQDETIRIDIALEAVAPKVKYNRSYSSSQAGLTAYVKHMATNGDIKIAVRQLDGDGYFSYGAANDSIPAASTYKLYVALRLFDDINQGDRKWRDKVTGESLSTCFERMIVVSANNCSEKLIKQFGPQKLTDYLHDRGFSNETNFNHPDAIHSTAADLLTLLIGIEDNSLVRGQNRDMLLEKMGRQIYRKGIPAGSAGKVYDKVGFLWDYNHDAAIIRHPKGSYALVVMTKGHSFDKIAEITRQLESIMYP